MRQAEFRSVSGRVGGRCRVRSAGGQDDGEILTETGIAAAVRRNVDEAEVDFAFTVTGRIYCRVGEQLDAIGRTDGAVQVAVNGDVGG